MEEKVLLGDFSYEVIKKRGFTLAFKILVTFSFERTCKFFPKVKKVIVGF